MRDEPNPDVDGQGARPARGGESPELQRLRAEIEELDRRVRRLRGLQNEPAAELVSQLVELEQEYLRLSFVAADLEPEAGAAQGHPLLPHLDRWRTNADQLGLQPVLVETQELIRRCAGDEAAELESNLSGVLASPAPGGCFDALRRITTLTLELKSHNGDAGEAGQRIAALRRQVQQSFIRCLITSPPHEEQRQAWRDVLIDQCDSMLTSIDDMPPGRAADHLDVVIDDVKWHLEYVETARGPVRRHLARKLRRVKDERQERALQHKLEQKFGPSRVARFERLVLALIFLVLGLLMVEMTFFHDPPDWLLVIDSLACGVFLLEFFVKLWYVRGKGRWFYRHFLIDFVPSLPFSLLLLSDAQALRAGRALRFYRLARVVRYIRIARPFIRMLRAVTFLLRGMDRLVRRYGPLLNKNVILYPKREERARARRQEASLAPRLRRVKSELHNWWERMLVRSEPSQREDVARARLATWRTAHEAGLTRRPPPPAGSTREITVEKLLRQMAGANAYDIEDQLGKDLSARLARVVRVFSRRPLRWLPIIRSFVPRITPAMSDALVNTAASKSVAARLKKIYERWLWVADLHGTVTPSQVIDRLGSFMVRSAIRPAARLALIGGLFLLVRLLINLTRDDSLVWVKNFLNGFIGPTLLVLGAICLVVLAVGWWLRRIAQEATEYYERAAQAQYLPLTEIIRCRHLEKAAELVYDRVLGPEWRLRNSAAIESQREDHLQSFVARIRQSLLGDINSKGPAGSDVVERVVLLYRDSLDGAMFVDSDMRTTCQLLGNPAVQQILSLCRRMERRDHRELQLLDLDRQKSLLGGPYLWFNFISRSIAHSVACSIVDYNRHAIPLAERELASEEEQRQFQAWLSAGEEQAQSVPPPRSATGFTTTAFTALHFLDYDPQRDEEVRQRFGEQVLKRLKRDRSLVIRRVFGTYPWHQLPKDRRTINVFTLYNDWLGGGKALFLPLTLAWRWLRLCGTGLNWIIKLINEIRHPERDYSGAAEADFTTAARKIQRMREPVVLATMKLRAKIDAEYLGVPLPGQRKTGMKGANVEADLKFLDAEPPLIEEMRDFRRRAESDIRRLEKLLEDGLLQRAAERAGLPADALNTPEHLRAATVAYIGDYRGLRRLLSAEEILRDIYRIAALQPQVPPPLGLRWRLRRRFRRYWRRHGQGDPAARNAAWRATANNHNGVADALVVWDTLGPDARSQGEEILGELLRHPGRISEQIITLRAIQTLALLDILHYREHVFELGRYAEMGDEREDLLAWGGG